MDIKQAIREVAWMSRMATAASDGDVFKKAIRNLRIKKQLESIDAWADMAEAALAYMEHQATSVHDPDECDLDRAQQRATLWDAFMEARARAKAANQ